MYLVKTEETQQLVGIFCAKDSSQLFDLVDQDLDPFACVYLKLQTGDGLFLDGEFVVAKDDDYTYTRIDGKPDSQVRMTEELYDRMPTGKRGWRKFTASDFSRAFGLPLKVVKDPAMRSKFKEIMDLAVPT